MQAQKTEENTPKQALEESRDRIRVLIIEAYQKHLSHQILSPLESSLVDIIQWHPELTDWLNQDHLKTEFEEDNPFFHIGLHMSIREQVVTDRPNGIRAVFEKLLDRIDVHQAEHQMMSCLAHHLAEAQKTGMPDEVAYLADLKLI